MRRLALLFPIALAACVEEPAPIAGTCGASGLQDLVGQSETVLQTMRFNVPVRVIHPGTAVTMDYRDDRLNIEINEAGTIFRVACG